MPYDFDLFVIGGGSAGVRCADIAAGHGAQVAIAEDRFWGGTCVNAGCVPKKLLVQAGEYGAWADDAAGFGWTIMKGPHDWRKLLIAKDREIGRLGSLYRNRLEEAGVTIIDKRATFIDTHTLDVGGQKVSADRIVIAVGGHPVRPPIPGAELGIVSDGAFHLSSMPKRVAVVGSGYIAAEFVGIFLALGSHVDLVFRQSRPLRGFDRDVRATLAEEMQSQGIVLHPEAIPREVLADGSDRTLALESGKVLDVNMVFFATGRRPTTANLGLEKAGVAVDSRGAVIVDNARRTSQRHIYAIGDVTDRISLTPVATAEGHAVADTLFGTHPRSISLEYIPSAVFSCPPVSTVGLTEEQAAESRCVDIYVTRFTPMRHSLSGRARKTMMKLIVDKITRRVLGAHMVGDDAPEIMQGIAIAMAMGATKDDFDRTIGIHPTAAEEFVTIRTRTRIAGHVKDVG